MKIQEFIAEDSQRYVLYLNGQPVSYYSSEDEAEYQGRMIAQRVPNTQVEVKKETCKLTPVDLNENLRKWFKEKWVRFGPDGKIRGACARGSDSEGKPKCLPQSKAHALGKKGRASAAAKKRREDPNPERRGKAKNVATKVREQRNANYNTAMHIGRELEQEYQDLWASREGPTNPHHTASLKKSIASLKRDLEALGYEYDVSAKKIMPVRKQSVEEEQLDEKCWAGYRREGNKEMFGKTVPNCVKNKE